MKKILVIQNKRIGDVLIVSIIAQNMKKIFPDSIIDYLVYDYTVGVIENNPSIDNIITINEANLKKFGNVTKLALKLRKNRYDIIFDPYAKFQSRWICLLSNAKKRISFKKRNKNTLLPFYTHTVPFLNQKTKNCGKVIEDRVNLVRSFFDIDESHIDYHPKIVLTEAEKKYDKLDKYNKPFVMLGVLGSTPQKSMPYEYIVEIINHITKNYNVNILFNYAPHQKDDALSIYEQCADKDQIIVDIYEDSIRGFVKLMNKCTLLVGNEGGTIHISKALNKPTFTIFSPYVLKEHWASFEDGTMHTSIHLLEEKPDLFSTDREARRKIEEDPSFMYKQLTPELIIPKLNTFLSKHLKSTNEHNR